MRISDWSSDVCSSDLPHTEHVGFELRHEPAAIGFFGDGALAALLEHRGTVIEVDQRGARVEIGNEPGVGVARGLSGIAEFDPAGDIRGARQADGYRPHGDGDAIDAGAARNGRGGATLSERGRT